LSSITSSIPFHPPILRTPKFFVNAGEVDALKLVPLHSQPQQCLGHSIDLIVICALREGSTFVDEPADPNSYLRIQQVNIAGFDLRADGMGPSLFAAFRIYRDQARQLML